MSAQVAEAFDAIVIGSGQGGNPLAGALVAAGKRTALIERQDVGGTCINRGCTPTKTMVASARAAYMARRGADYGVHLGPVTVDMGRVRERKRAIVQSWREGGEKRLEKAHVELIRGEASFTGPRQIRVALHGGGERQLSAAQFFINTGTHSGTPAIEGLNTVPYLDNESIMELDYVPEHLVILGGGYIGVEFSQMFRRFGSQVTVIQSGPQLLREEDQEVAEEVVKILRQDGIEILFNAHTQKVARAKGRTKFNHRTSKARRRRSKEPICWWPPAGCPTPRRSSLLLPALRSTSEVLSGRTTGWRPPPLAFMSSVM